MQQIAGLVSLLALLALGVPLPGRGVGLPEHRNLQGITVVGRGVVRVPADAMHLEVRFFSRAGAGSIDTTGQTVAKTMRENGIPDARWTLPLTGMLGNNSAGVIVGTIRKPTREIAEATARKIAAALPDSLAGSVQNFNVASTLSVDDCSAAEGRAQDAAISDARVRAKRVAAAAGMTLGEIVAVDETSSFPNPACQRNSDGTNFAGREPEDALGPLDVTIAVTATVAFAVR